MSIGERFHLTIMAGRVWLGGRRVKVYAECVPTMADADVHVKVGGEARRIGVTVAALGRSAHLAVHGVLPLMDERWTGAWLDDGAVLAGVWYDPFAGGGPRVWFRRRGKVAA